MLLLPLKGQNFRGHVQGGPAQRVGHGGRAQVPGEAKVRDLQSGSGTVRGQEQVLRLDVAVHQFVLPEEDQAVGQMPHEVLGDRLTGCKRRRDG